MNIFNKFKALFETPSWQEVVAKEKNPESVIKKSSDELFVAKPQKSEMAGIGCALLLLACLAPIIGFFISGSLGALLAGGAGGIISAFGGTALASTIGAILFIVGIVLFIAGSVTPQKWVCNACKNPLHSKEVSMCPICKTILN